MLQKKKKKVYMDVAGVIFELICVEAIFGIT